MGMDKNCSDAATDRRTLGKCLQSSHITGCNPPHGKELHSSHFHFCKRLFLQMYLVLGRTDIHMHRKASSKERLFNEQPTYLGTRFQATQAHSLYHFGLQIIKTTVSIPSSSSALSLIFTVLQDGVLIIHME